jgi:hypothetical protein
MLRRCQVQRRLLSSAAYKQAQAQFLQDSMSFPEAPPEVKLQQQQLLEQATSVVQDRCFAVTTLADSFDQVSVR